MKWLLFSFILLGISASKCIKKPDKKLYVKSVEFTSKIRIDWYVYSSISNFAPDYLQISSYDEKPFFSSFYVSDINLRNDSLIISLWNNEYHIDTSLLNDIKVGIDTLGKQWNQASSRIGRLRARQVDILKPHFIDTYCPNGECEQAQK